jgi:hypothetical protein
MEYSMSAVAKRMILVIIGLSVAIAAGGYVFYHYRPAITLDYAIPFALGVAVAMVVNIIKVLWLKIAVDRAVNRDPRGAQLYLQGQYFLRLLFTGAAFFAVGFMHDPQRINVIGMVIGIFTLPIATYSMHFLLKGYHSDVITGVAALPTNSAQDAIDEINTIVAEASEKEGV